MNLLAKRQQGIALISMLLVFSLVVILISATVSRGGLEIRKTANLMQNSQAYQYALGGEALARQILHKDWEEDKTNGLADHQGEAWFTESLFEPEMGKMKIVIHDLQGRFNINNLIGTNDKPDAHQQQILNRILQQAAPDTSSIGNTVDALTDWLDKDTDPSVNSSEDSHFLGQSPPYRSADRLITDISELTPAAALTPQQLIALKPYLAALPQRTPINPNTASATVLKALDSRLPADEIVSLRESRAFMSNNDFLISDVTAGIAINAADINVQSSYFEASITAQYQDATVYLRAVLHRDAESGTITLISRDLQRPRASPKGLHTTIQ